MNYSNISDYIKSVRIERGLSLDDVARLVGVSKSTVHKWETGYIANMRKDSLVRLASALDIDPSFLLSLGLDKEGTSPLLVGNELDRQIIDLFRSLPEQDKMKAIGYLQALSDK